MRRIHAAAPTCFRSAIGDAIPKHAQHSRHLVHPSVQTNAIGRGERPQVAGEKDVIVELSCRSESDR